MFDDSGTAQFNMVEIAQIESLSESIARQFQPDSIFLFGSYAYGEPGQDSDVDLLIIMPFEGKPSRKALEILSEIEPRFPVDLIVRTPAQVAYRIAHNDSFMLEIFQRGRKLYESDSARMDGKG